MTTDISPEPAQRVLALPLPEGNDAEAATIRDYLVALLSTLWREADGFSGKRPFGDSGWQYDVYIALIKAGLIGGSLDEDGYVEHVDHAAGDQLILAAIDELGRAS
jgi:hypothetical protein